MSSWDCHCNDKGIRWNNSRLLLCTVRVGPRWNRRNSGLLEAKTRQSNPVADNSSNLKRQAEFFRRITGNNNGLLHWTLGTISLGLNRRKQELVSDPIHRVAGRLSTRRQLLLSEATSSHPCTGLSTTQHGEEKMTRTNQRALTCLATMKNWQSTPFESKTTETQSAGITGVN